MEDYGDWIRLYEALEHSKKEACDTHRPSSSTQCALENSDGIGPVSNFWTRPATPIGDEAERQD